MSLNHQALRIDKQTIDLIKLEIDLDADVTPIE